MIDYEELEERYDDFKGPRQTITRKSDRFIATNKHYKKAKISRRELKREGFAKP